ncbi:helix-turn-helix domain-containing protein [Vibrio parahaemolyticus]|uniref:helix-turn-helix domain-containing protein n=1 Tax=Vibrio parahaemolyticus TaxID=670 RepID=UPI00111F62AB|nr:helix-turn-helix domain-containing protein [Vibrio parahaemolyticus]TOI16300.1 DNA-binding protein [Vibrio parahaemolyticus]
MTSQFVITNQILDANLKQSHGYNATEKMVLVILSRYFGKPEGSSVFSCFPSQSTIATRAGCSRSTVNTTLQKLEEDGFVRSRWQTNDSGANTSKLYIWLGIPATEEPDSERSDESNESEVVETRTEVLEAITEVPVVESARVIQPEVRHEPVPTSGWWPDLEAAIAEDELPF